MTTYLMKFGIAWIFQGFIQTQWTFLFFARLDLEA